MNQQRIRQPAKINDQIKLNQPVRFSKIFSKYTPTQTDLVSTNSEFNKSNNRQSITPTLKIQKERPNLPKSSQTSTVSGSLLYQMKGQYLDTQNQSPTQDFEFNSTPTQQTSSTMRVQSPTESERRVGLGGREYKQKLPEPFSDLRLNSQSPTQEQMSRVRGTFQRENISNEEKQKMLEQKRQMKEVLDQQIEEKKKKQLKDKEFERELQRQDEDRIKKEIEDEVKQKINQQKQKQQKEIQTIQTPLPLNKERVLISSPSESSKNQLKRSISKDSFRSGGQIKIGRDENLENSREHEQALIIKQALSVGGQDQIQPLSNENLNYIQSAQGFYLQTEYIQFLKQQNEDLKAENDKKDQLIQGLIGTKPKASGQRNSSDSINVNNLGIKNQSLKNDQINNPTNPTSPLYMNSMNMQNLIKKSQSSNLIRPIPNSQQEKKTYFQRLPQITTPQPQLNHQKMANEDNMMDLFPTTKEKQDKESYISRQKLFISKQEESNSNWSFGKNEQPLPQVYLRELSTFAKKKQSQLNQFNSCESLLEPSTINEFCPKVALVEIHQSLLPSHAIKKTINLPQPPQLTTMMQFQSELPGQSTFLKSENNHVNPEFTFSNSIAEHFMDHTSINLGSSKKAKEKLPKEFQIVPQKRKFFI